MFVVVINSDADLSCIYMYLHSIWTDMVHSQKKIILLGLLLSIRGTSSKWCWTCQCIFARWSLLGPELGCCSSMSFDIDIMIHVCVTRWMARCKQPESEDWLDADQWTCQVCQSDWLLRCPIGFGKAWSFLPCLIIASERQFWQKQDAKGMNMARTSKRVMSVP